MLFNSFDFFLFFVFVFTVQLALPHRARNLFLLCASYFFYGCWNWNYLALMAGSTLIGFFCSQKIAYAVSSEQKQRYLKVCVVSNLVILGFFKYFNFFADSIQQVAHAWGSELSGFAIDVILPVGISFYIFQVIGYCVDVYRGDVKHLASLIDFSLYVAFFPQLVAGPIERGSHLVPQIHEGRRTSWGAVGGSVWLILKGLFKKCVLADNLAPIVSSVFASESPTSFQVLIGVYAFAFQIYGDFSGYTDIARGVGRMLGYDLMLNFRLPYFATNPSEFWQRWHISLSSWLRDYLYIPLGGNRGTSLSTYRNLLLTMLLGGLWHGAAWNFVIWGAYHGFLLIGHRVIQGAMKQNESWLRWSYFPRIFVMFHLTCLGWMIFRADSVSQIGSMLHSLAMCDFSMSYADAQNFWKLCLLILPILALQVAQEYTKNLNFVPQLSIVPRAVIYAMVVLAIVMLGTFGQQEFIYFQF